MNDFEKIKTLEKYKDMNLVAGPERINKDTFLNDSYDLVIDNLYLKERDSHYTSEELFTFGHIGLNHNFAFIFLENLKIHLEHKNSIIDTEIGISKGINESPIQTAKYLYNSFKTLNKDSTTNEYLNLGKLAKKNLRELLLAYSKDDLQNIIDLHLNDWINFIDSANVTKKANIDISDNIEIINNLSDSFKSLSFYDELNQHFTAIITFLTSIQQYEDDFFNDSSNINKKENLINARLNLLNKLIEKEQYFKQNSIDKDFIITFNNLNIFTNVNLINEEFANIYQKSIDSENSIILSKAEYYFRKNQSSNNQVSSFLDTKINEENVKFSFDILENFKYKSIICFKDDSLLLKTSRDELKVIKNNTEASHYIQLFFDKYIELKFNKNPTLAKEFKRILKLENYNLSKASPAINTYFNNQDILKNSKFQLIDNYDNFEKLDDKMNEVIIDYKIKQYAHSIASKKYITLYNERSYEIIKNIYKMGIEQSVLQSMIGKKMAAYKTSDEFNRGLHNLYQTLNDFTPDLIIGNANSKQTKIIINEKDFIVLKIDNFDQSNHLGSLSWCISRDNHYFKSYTEKGNAQYFVYDFKEESTTNKSMIGITLTPQGNLYAAHLKNDESYKQNEHLNSLINKIIIAEQKNDKTLYIDNLIESKTKKNMTSTI